MRILGGLINLLNPVDRAIGFGSFQLDVVNQNAQYTTDTRLVSAEADEIYHISAISVSIRCDTIATTPPFFVVDVMSRTSAGSEGMAKLRPPTLAVGESYEREIPVDIYCRDTEGVNYIIDSLGSADGLYDICITAHYQRISK